MPSERVLVKRIVDKSGGDVGLLYTAVFSFDTVVNTLEQKYG